MMCDELLVLWVPRPVIAGPHYDDDGDKLYRTNTHFLSDDCVVFGRPSIFLPGVESCGGDHASVRGLRRA